MTTAVEKATAIIEMKLRTINERPRVQLMISGTNPVNVYSTVNNGRGPRNVTGEITSRLPIIGSRDLSRMGDDLDRERAELVVVFTISGIINGVPYDNVTIWIQGNARELSDQVSLPTNFSGTKNASHIMYELGRQVRDHVVRMPNLEEQAWQAHLAGVISRVGEHMVYLAAVARAAEAQQLAGVDS
jgi:hypothetical protein